MPPVVRGSERPEALRKTQSDSIPAAASTNSPIHDRRVTFDQHRAGTSDSLPPVHFSSQRSYSGRRHSSHHSRHRRDFDEEEKDVYYDSRAATRREFRRRATTLQSYYNQHPELLPQLPFTLRRGFKRWKLAGYIALMIFDACILPLMLYYAMTFGGNIQGYITFAVVTAIWGGPTYVELAVRTLRLIKKEHFYKPLGANNRWAFDITNWILVLTIASVTSLLIVGAAPHIVFLRVLSMPAPAILLCLSGPIFLLSLYSACGWKAPFRISSTAKGEKVLPGVYYICEDIIAVNAGGGRPFREGLAARYNASPIFRKMIRDLSWFWSIPGLFLATGCTVVVCIHTVSDPVAYGIGWSIPFIWGAFWALITMLWVRSTMARERRNWEEAAPIDDDKIKERAPAAAAPDPVAENKSESSTLHAVPGRQDDTVKHEKPDIIDGSESPRLSGGTNV